jgi:predicted AAA+ superfamily ATPase
LLLQIYGKKSVFFIDEIQNVAGWENFVRRFYEKDIKMIITGSNASLLSKEIGTKLTGRYQKVELYPFSFTEWLAYHNKSFYESDLIDTEKRAALKRYFADYCKMGGMPEYLKYQEKDILKRLYEDILYRDIAARYQIKEVDFLVKNGADNIKLIQVCHDLKDEKTRQREISALAEACKELNVGKGVIITENEKDNLTVDHKKIIIVPCYEWLLFKKD